MNSDFNTLTDWDLDRLVDGELSADEYRVVLAAVESSEDGWRRCATAFLENQALERDLQSMSADVYETPRKSAERVEPKSPPSLDSRSLVGQLVVIVASFVLAWFGAMAWMRYHSSVVELQSNPPVNSRPQDHEGRETRDGFELRVDGTDFVASEFPVILMRGPDGLDQRTRVWPAQSEGMIKGLPNEVAQILRDHGKGIRLRQRLANVELDDGRSAVVPIDQLEIVPVSLSDLP